MGESTLGIDQSSLSSCVSSSHGSKDANCRGSRLEWCCWSDSGLLEFVAFAAGLRGKRSVG
ncbi:hypothetical protein KY284_010212 [Solanum tuberosum]|nr:hypothetical protein KY284_010212 [Solanum tuberosum]